MSSTTAWSHSSDLLNYALSTNNSELIALLSQARDLIQSDCRKAIDSRRQVSITDFFADNCEKSVFLFFIDTIINLYISYILYMPSVYFMTITSYSTTMHSNRVGLQCGA